MGFFDKLKSIKNAVTGGSADVFIQAEEGIRGEPFTVVVQVRTKDAPVKLNGAYLKLQGFEEVEVPDVDIEFDGDARREFVHRSSSTFETEIQVTGPEELEPNREYEWQVDVSLPADAPPAYRGRYARHSYKMIAGLDCFGNDPDSGWQEIYIH